MVQSQPWLERDRAMIDILLSIGIEKGKPFNPSAELSGLLGEAAQEAQAWFVDYYENSFKPHFPGKQWFLLRRRR